MQQLNSFCIHQTPGTAGKQLTSSFRLDTCSIVQVRKSQKADSVHVDVAFSVGENSTSRWEESDFWVLLTALIYFTVPAFIHTEVLITKCWSDFDCRLTAEDQHHDSSFLLLPLPVNDGRFSGTFDSCCFGNVVKRCLLFCESRELLTMSAYTSDHDTKICQCDFKRDEQQVNVFAVFVLQRAAVIKDPSGALNDKILPRC